MISYLPVLTENKGHKNDIGINQIKSNPISLGILVTGTLNFLFFFGNFLNTVPDVQNVWSWTDGVVIRKEKMRKRL